MLLVVGAFMGVTRRNNDEIGSCGAKTPTVGGGYFANAENRRGATQGGGIMHAKEKVVYFEELFDSRDSGGLHEQSFVSDLIQHNRGTTSTISVSKAPLKITRINVLS